jgi:hypothetical protein
MAAMHFREWTQAFGERFREAHSEAPLSGEKRNKGDDVSIAKARR